MLYDTLCTSFSTNSVPHTMHRMLVPPVFSDSITYFLYTLTFCLHQFLKNILVFCTTYWGRKAQWGKNNTHTVFSLPQEDEEVCPYTFYYLQPPTGVIRVFSKRNFISESKSKAWCFSQKCLLNAVQRQISSGSLKFPLEAPSDLYCIQNVMKFHIQ